MYICIAITIVKMCLECRETDLCCFTEGKKTRLKVFPLITLVRVGITQKYQVILFMIIYNHIEGNRICSSPYSSLAIYFVK